MVAEAVCLAARAIILHDHKLLLVNARAQRESKLLCAPGGGVEAGASLPENLAREVFEETGLRIAVGAPCLINEFHDPRTGFHQVEVFFRCQIEGASEITDDWRNPEKVVTRRIWTSAKEIGG